MLAYDDPTAGHLGHQKTLRRVLTQFWWPNVNTDVAAYIRSCTQCLKRQPPHQRPKAPLMDRPRPTGPFETVEAAFKGLLPSSADGCRFILVLQDTFSKYAKMHPVVAPTSDITCSRLLVWISRCGVPTTFRSDGGSCFTSFQFRDFCTRFGIKHTLSTPAHPQANGAVERLNRTMAEALTKVVNEDQLSCT